MANQVVVIGAGLARQGYRVTVLEKNEQPGGRAGQLTVAGHRIDTGPTLLLMPEVLSETCRALGEHMHTHLDLRRIDPTYRVHFGDGGSLALTSDINAMQAPLDRFEPGSFTGFLRFLEEGHRHYRLSLDKFVGRPIRSLSDYVHPQNLPLLFQLKAFKNHYRNIGRYISDPRLKAAFTFQNMYLWAVVGHQFGQVGYLRPHNRHRRYNNLSFSGASTHPGTGLPIVLLSARLTAQRILEAQGAVQSRVARAPQFTPAWSQWAGRTMEPRSGA